VSTDDQQLHLQLDALTTACCTQIFHDEGISGAQVRRPGLDAALAALTPGDVLVVWRLDWLGRSMPHLVNLVHTLGLQGVGFQSLTEAINTTTAGGKLVFHIMGALAAFERALIAERSQAGMQAARRRGKYLGRPRKLTRAQVTHAARMVQDGTETVSGMAALYGVDRVTLHRALKRVAASAVLCDSGARFPPWWDVPLPLCAVSVSSAPLQPSRVGCGAPCVPWQARIRPCCADVTPSCCLLFAGDNRCKHKQP
jgi:DNA invertase Pin-like site-specific DNA recombinase